MRSALPESLAANRPSEALKTYTLVRSPGANSSRALEFQEDGHPVLFMEKETHFMSATQINIRGGEKNHILAASKLPSWSGGVKVHLGPPGEDWQRVALEKVKHPKRAQYEFVIGGVRYCWRMTHNKGLGVDSFGDLGLELLNMASQDKVLAIFSSDKKLGRKSGVAGRVAFFADLSEELEALALATVLGIDEHTRNARSASSSGAAAAAAGAAASGGGGGGC